MFVSFITLAYLGVGGSIKLMNKTNIHIMNRITKSIASTVVIFAMVISAVVTPSTVLAVDTTFGGFDFPTLPAFPDTDSSGGESVSTSNFTFTECKITASRETITAGEGVDLTWSTSGFTDFTLNGEVLATEDGVISVSNILVNTTYTLQAWNDNGSSCTSRVTITCLPQPTECILEINKAVNKSTAVPGDELTYTINVKNIGDADCTGDGVKIHDVLDSNLMYLSNTVSSNITAGYGSSPVYTESDRTLRFNGNTLTPGEVGTITIKVKVATPAPANCGDFNIPNKAKTTAKELNNFGTWVYSQTVNTAIDNDCVTPQPACTLLPLTQTISYGGTATLTWTTTNVTSATLTSFGPVALNDSATTEVLYADATYVLTATGPAGTIECPVTVYVPPPTNKSATVIAEKIVCTNEAELPNFGLGGPDMTASTAADWVASHASCSLVPDWKFQWATTNSDPGKDFVGEAGAPWRTFGPTNSSGRTSVDIALDQDSSRIWFREVLKTGFIPFTTSNLDAVLDNTNNVSAEFYCHSDVQNYDNLENILLVDGGTYHCVAWNSPVVDVPAPTCDLFEATPGTIAPGGTSVLTWETTNAVEVYINNGIGTQVADNTNPGFTVSPLATITYILTAIGIDGTTVDCEKTITVVDSPVFSCANNVSFSASDTSITRGQSPTLTWSTTNVDSVSISQINATTLSGEQSVTPSSDTTYTLSATKGSETVNCPVSIAVSGGGGGGGSTPRCDLEISDSKIKSGDQITLTWDTSNATEITITDDRGKVIFTTDDYLSTDKKDYFDGSIKLRPTRDTQYTLLAERGSRDKECKVEVELEDSVVVLQTRDQQPLVAGISLSQVPYTGFEAGPVLTVLFYLLLVAWALYITYLLVIRRQLAAGFNGGQSTVMSEFAQLSEPEVASVVASGSITPSFITHRPNVDSAPTNLPTATQTVGYENHVEENESTGANPHQVSDSLVTALENRAHQQKALLSSDAVRHFIATTEGVVERNSALDDVVAEAKKHYPLEDGWIVLNEARMRSLCETCRVNAAEVKTTTPYIPATVPEGTGSLAEAIVTGNIVAAYEMIGNRPMFALADAAADLDAVYRNRRGGKMSVSDMLIAETVSLSDEQIKNMITALTGAIDGTYTDEASAVKMAIMKAVKEAA